MIMALLLLSVVAGIFSGYLVTIDIPSNLATFILVALVFVVGVEVGSSERLFFKLRLSFARIFWQSLLTTFGTFTGAWLCSFILPFNASESLAASSGFGWYSLSGTMISTMYSPLLGAVSFSANVFREVFAIMLVPVLIKRFPYGAISLGGATTMDTLLGLVSRYSTPEYTLIAFGQGVILSLSVPLWIPLFLR